MTDHEICVYRITDKPMACEICGHPYHPPEGEALTLADVMKAQGQDVVVCCGYFSLHWDGEHWIVYQQASYRVEGGIRLATTDESAACAEFLRLTGGES